MQDYRKLDVWQKAHKLALNVYAVSAYLKKPETWPTRDQMFRAAISIRQILLKGEAGDRMPTS